MANNNYNNISKNKNVKQTNEKVSSTKPVEEKVVDSIGVVLNGYLNIRKGPSLDDEILCVVEPDEKMKIDVKNSTAEWLKVKTSNGVIGFCMEKFVKH